MYKGEKKQCIIDIFEEVEEVLMECYGIEVNRTMLDRFEEDFLKQVDISDEIDNFVRNGLHIDPMTHPY